MKWSKIHENVLTRPHHVHIAPGSIQTDHSCQRIMFQSGRKAPTLMNKSTLKSLWCSVKTQPFPQNVLYEVPIVYWFIPVEALRGISQSVCKIMALNVLCLKKYNKCCNFAPQHNERGDVLRYIIPHWDALVSQWHKSQNWLSSVGSFLGGESTDEQTVQIHSPCAFLAPKGRVWLRLYPDTEWFGPGPFEEPRFRDSSQTVFSLFLPPGGCSPSYVFCCLWRNENPWGWVFQRGAPPICNTTDEARGDSQRGHYDEIVEYTRGVFAFQNGPMSGHPHHTTCLSDSTLNTGNAHPVDPSCSACLLG